MTSDANRVQKSTDDLSAAYVPDDEVKAQRDRLAQACWLLRDTTSEGSYVHNVVSRALEEARIDEPEDDGGC